MDFSSELSYKKIFFFIKKKKKVVIETSGGWFKHKTPQIGNTLATVWYAEWKSASFWAYGIHSLITEHLYTI